MTKLSSREKAVLAIYFIAKLKHPPQSPPEIQAGITAKLLDYYWKKFFPHLSKTEILDIAAHVQGGIVQCTNELSTAWNTVFPKKQETIPKIESSAYDVDPKSENTTKSYIKINKDKKFPSTTTTKEQAELSAKERDY